MSIASNTYMKCTSTTIKLFPLGNSAFLESTITYLCMKLELTIQISKLHVSVIDFLKMMSSNNRIPRRTTFFCMTHGFNNTNIFVEILIIKMRLHTSMPHLSMHSKHVIENAKLSKYEASLIRKMKSFFGHWIQRKPNLWATLWRLVLWSYHPQDICLENVDVSG